MYLLCNAVYYTTQLLLCIYFVSYFFHLEEVHLKDFMQNQKHWWCLRVVLVMLTYMNSAKPNVILTWILIWLENSVYIAMISPLLCEIVGLCITNSDHFHLLLDQVIYLLSMLIQYSVLHVSSAYRSKAVIIRSLILGWRTNEQYTGGILLIPKR